MRSGDFFQGRAARVGADFGGAPGGLQQGGADGATKPSGPPPVNVTLSPARAVELQRSVQITGSLVGLETATISNRVAGRITKVYVDRGDRVKPGQTLLEIEPDRFKLAVDDSQAALQQTLARLGLKDVPSEEFDINQTAPVKKSTERLRSGQGQDESRHAAEPVAGAERF